MGVDDSSVATTALVIAIAAFITAFGQLLQQLFVTADGLRRCQSSVIGGWSQLVQLRFRWSSLRYEVRVVTPHFAIAPPGVLRTSVRKWVEPPSLLRRPFLKRSSLWCDASDPVVMIDTKLSRMWTSLETIENASTEEPVSWLSLIEDIHELQNPDFIHLEHVELLSFTRLTRSWDFMPAEIVRPFASTTIGCLVSIVHRMGLVWIDFRPDEGIIRATARGRSISVSRIRGLGLVIEYTRNGTGLMDNVNQSVGTENTDKMACGILPGSHGLFNCATDLLLRDRNKPVEAQLSHTFRFLELDEFTIETLHQSLAHKSTTQILPGFADLLGLWSDWVPIPITEQHVVRMNLALERGYNANIAESPFPIDVESMGQRLEPRVVWRYLLKRHVSDSLQLKRVVAIYDEWESTNPDKFRTRLGHCFVDGDENSKIMASFSKAVFLETQLYFERLGAVPYWYLVKAHVVVNAQSVKQAELNMQSGVKRPQILEPQGTNHYQGDPTFTERAFVYVENIPDVISKVRSEMATSGFRAIFSPIEFEEAWWMMMLRMQVWNISVKLVMREGLTIPHQYYGDPSRVYIL